MLIGRYIYIVVYVISILLLVKYLVHYQTFYYLYFFFNFGAIKKIKKNTSHNFRIIMFNYYHICNKIFQKIIN